VLWIPHGVDDAEFEGRMYLVCAPTNACVPACVAASQVEQLRQQLASKDSQQRQLQQHLSDTQQRLTSTEQQATALQQQLGEKDIQLMELKQQQEQQQQQEVSCVGDPVKVCEPAVDQAEVNRLRKMVAGLEASLKSVSSQLLQQQVAGAADSGAAVAAAKAETEMARQAAAELQVQVEALKGQLAAAAAATEGKAAELRFLQRQFEEVTGELREQQQQVCLLPWACVGC
jgi:chromosome segregation ATPase